MRCTKCVPFYKVKCLTSLLSVVEGKGTIGLMKACFKGMISSTLKRQTCNCKSWSFAPLTTQRGTDKLSFVLMKGVKTLCHIY